MNRLKTRCLDAIPRGETLGTVAQCYALAARLPRQKKSAIEAFRRRKDKGIKPYDEGCCVKRIYSVMMRF